ncbi:hypothetical protein PIB30_059448 [Stylosanthes scabra]|uniref:TF-B3 domain-containing protein n=1 Tax=Stylosanthes scabra TaxID=79078 RepID=A0ABU6XK23_9FABA|nr:hypothetical protein [Stylosanthes scabra]
MVTNIIRFITLQKLPNKFTNKYGSGLPNPLYLKPPDGTEWKVDWTNHDGGILFEKGWKEFAAYYSLDNGHLLCFEYKGTSHIQVHILDMSGLEIDYPTIAVPAHDQIKEQLPRRRGRPRKSLKEPIPSSPSTSKQLRSGITTIDVDSSPKRKRLNEPLPGVRSRPRKKQKAPMSSPFKVVEGSKSSVRPCLARPESLKEAKKFEWENPSFFIKITQWTQSRGPTYFSTKFFRKYFENNPQDVEIRFRKEVFPAKFVYRPSSCNAYISAGWTGFAKASKLQVGDVCLFKLINRKDPVLDVQICRRLGRESHSKPVTHGIHLLEKAKELNSENPSLMVKIKNSDPSKSRPNLSGVFYRRYFKKNQQNVKLRFGKELLPAKFIYNPISRSAVFSAGWHAFAQACELDPGDVCFFELINGKDMFDVHICRAHY